MSIILAIETSSSFASTALLVGEQCIQQSTAQLTHSTTHTTFILPAVQVLLAETGLNIHQCDAIAFGCGPGSFTGVRTACGIAQGLAYGADLPVIPISTLLALAEQHRPFTQADTILAALDARMSEVYWAQYQYVKETLSWKTIISPTLSAPESLQPHIQKNLALVGNGFHAYPSAYSFNDSVMNTIPNSFPEASAIAKLAATAYLAGDTYPPEAAQPLYLRNKIALTTAERAQKKGMNHA